MAVGMDHLLGLYADSHDPWDFETSDYEHQKFKATCRAPSRAYYRSIFEFGCGNGQLARYLSEICEHYSGLDAVEKAINAARAAVPSGTFYCGYYPCPLPSDIFELLIFSEILYFLDQRTIQMLARDVASNWPDAEIICVSYLGPSGNEIQGDEAVQSFMAALNPTHNFEAVVNADLYRIDRGMPRARS